MRRLVRWSLCLTLVLFLHAEIADMGRSAFHAMESVDGRAMVLRAVGALVGAPSLLAFGLFSRIDESRTMQHESRQRLRNLIQSEPGLGLSQLCERASLGWGTTVYHLNRMERAGLVRSADIGRRRAFFLPEHDRREHEWSSVLANDAQLRLLQALRAKPNASQQELARAAGMGLPLANRYLRRLEDAGLLASKKEWKVRRYEATPRLESQWGELASRQMSTKASALLPLRPMLSPRGTNAL